MTYARDREQDLRSSAEWQLGRFFPFVMKGEMSGRLPEGGRELGRDWVTRLCTFLRVAMPWRGITTGISKLC